jgi:hypothetical protein
MEYVFLILALLFGTATHVLKKVVEVRKTDEDYHLKDWLTKFPYRTVLTFMAGIAGFLILLATDELTYASSFMAGYMANSLGGMAK